jgi:hypothetical protein
MASIMANAEIRSSAAKQSDAGNYPPGGFVGGPVASVAGADGLKRPIGGIQAGRPGLTSDDSMPNVPGRYPKEM